MEIDIFSDTICPWCFIGKRRLERALAERPQPNLTVHWRAFQLNPDMPAEGMDRQRYLEVKFGGEANAKSVYDNVRAAGESGTLLAAFLSRPASKMLGPAARSGIVLPLTLVSR